MNKTDASEKCDDDGEIQKNRDVMAKFTNGGVETNRAE
jgi:hypothetical protein